MLLHLGRYRCLDLRRHQMNANIILRHKVVKLIRRYLEDVHGFVEVLACLALVTAYCCYISLHYIMCHVILMLLSDIGQIETPILSRSTPEGARDYLVPSRVQVLMCYFLASVCFSPHWSLRGCLSLIVFLNVTAKSGVWFMALV